MVTQENQRQVKNILNLMREFQLRAASTFYDNNRKYNTWLGLPDPKTRKRQPYQLDHIFIPKQQLCHTKNVKRKFNGAHSDHAALLIEFYLQTNPLIKSTSKEDIASADPIKKLTTPSSEKKSFRTSRIKSMNFLTISLQTMLISYHQTTFKIILKNT